MLLLERDVPHLPFSAAVQKDLPAMPWGITDEVWNFSLGCVSLRTEVFINSKFSGAKDLMGRRKARG